MKCTECHRTVSKKDRFCPYCGARIVPRTRTPAPQKSYRRNASSGLNWPILLGVLALGVAIGAMAMYTRTNKGPQAQSSFNPALNGPQLATLYPRVYQIASQFTCPCGTCSDGLENCDCTMPGGAQEARSFIFAQLNQGYLPPDVIKTVERKYGHRKGTLTPNFGKLKPQLAPILPK